jgi:hypothetical protein
VNWSLKRRASWASSRLVKGVLTGEPFVAFTASSEAERIAALGTALAILRRQHVRIMRVGNTARGALSVPELMRDLSCNESEGSTQGDLERACKRLTELGEDESQVLLVVGAADRLDRAALSFLQMLAALFAQDEPKLQVLFVGGPAFFALVARAELRELREQIATWVALDPLPDIAGAPDLAHYPNGARQKTGKPELQSHRSGPKPGFNGRATIGRYMAVLTTAVGGRFGLLAGALLGSVFWLVLAGGLVLELPFDRMTRLNAARSVVSSRSPEVVPSPTSANASANNPPAQAAELAQNTSRARSFQAPLSSSGLDEFLRHLRARSGDPFPPSSAGQRRDADQLLSTRRVVVRYLAGSERAKWEATQIATSLAPKAGSVEIRAVDTAPRTLTIRYFVPEDRAAVQRLREALRPFGGHWTTSDFTGYRAKPRPDTIELWTRGG